MDTKNHSNFTTYIPTQLKPYMRSLQEFTGDNNFVFPGDNIKGAMAIPRHPLDIVTKKTALNLVVMIYAELLPRLPKLPCCPKQSSSDY